MGEALQPIGRFLNRVSQCSLDVLLTPGGMELSGCQPGDWSCSVSDLFTYSMVLLMMLRPIVIIARQASFVSRDVRNKL